MVKKMTRRVITTIMALVLVSGIFAVSSPGIIEAQAATVKLNKTKASIYVGQTVQLTLKNAKSVTWKSSSKKIATVTSKGKVKGIKAGSAKITATNKKTKKKYTCKITVKALKSFGLTADSMYVSEDGYRIEYAGAEIKDATYILDGNKLTINDYSIWTDDEYRDGIATVVELTSMLSEEEHVFEIQKTGYETFTYKFTYVGVKSDGIFTDEPLSFGGKLYLYCNSVLEERTYTVTVDGTVVQPEEGDYTGLTGEGVYTITVDVSELSSGTHTVTVAAEGLPDETKTFVVE